MAQLESYDDFTLSVVRDAWETFRRDALLYVLAAALVVIVSAVSLGLLTGPLFVGFIELVRRARLGEPVALGLVFSRFDTFVSSSVALFLIALGIFVGMFLLVIPGLLVSLFSTYVLQIITYERLGGIDAIRRSISLVRAYFVHTIAIVLVLWILQGLAGVLMIALLVTTPFALIMLTLAYERLEGATQAPGLVMER